MKNVVIFLNGLVLVGFGLWGYFQGRSATALIPVGFGTVLLVLYPSVRKEAMVMAHIAVLLTVLILIGLIKPLSAACERGDGGAIFRTSTMFISTLFALICFIKKFIDIRRARRTDASD